MKLTREFYRPKEGSGYVKYEPNLTDCDGYKEGLWEIWINLQDPEKFQAMFFSGKKSKYDWWICFHSVGYMEHKINNHISNILSWETKKQERKEERKNITKDIKVGDLFYSSWGYDQTNVDFYQVIAVKGKTFTIQEICGKSVPGSGGDYNGMADQVTAVRDAFVEPSDNHPILTKRSFNLDCGFLSPTTETEKHYRSWYA